MGRQLKLAQVESEILQYSSSANFPQPTGSIKYLYLDQSANTLYRWDALSGLNGEYVLLNSATTPPTSGSAEGELYFADLVTSARLMPCNYNNGVSGSGATLISTGSIALGQFNQPGKIDNTTPLVDDIILVRSETSTLRHGLYSITDLGSPTSSFVLTRVSYYDTGSEVYPSQITGLRGATGANQTYIQQTPNPIVGSSPILFQQAPSTSTQTLPILFIDTVTTAPLPLSTYATGSIYVGFPGAGATLTATASGALGVIGGITASSNVRILAVSESNPVRNGSYTVTAPGSATTPWKLTRIDYWTGMQPNIKEFVVSRFGATEYGSRYVLQSSSITPANIGISQSLIFQKYLSPSTGGGITSAFPFTGSAIITGSLTVTGSIIATTGFSGSLQGTASFAQTASYVLNAVSSSYAETASLAPLYLPLTGGTISGNVSVLGTASIAFLNVTYESASVIYSSGSNQFGDATNDTQTLIGRTIISGSLEVTGSANLPNITGSLFGTSSWATNAITASYITSSNVHGPFGANSILSASFTTTASYAMNGGVTQLLAGANITLGPTNGLGQVTVSSTGGGGSSFNTATGSYGSFYSTVTQTNVASTARSMSLNITDISNGVSISGSTNPFNTYIKTENAGVYDIQFSAQVDKTDSGTDEIWIWLRKNGTDLTDTATSLQLVGNGAHYVAAWNFFVNAAANDYFQLMWYSPDANVRLHAESAFGVVPGIPSLIVTANRVDQFLSNTGSFSGSFNGVFTGSLQGTATTASFVTASNVIGTVTSASFATSASWAPDTTFPYTGSAIVTGSIILTGSLQVAVPSTAAAASELARFKPTDSTSFLQIINYSTTQGAFIPTIRTLHSASSTSVGLQLIAQIGNDSAANANPAMTFLVMSQSAAVGQIRNRTLFTWENNNTSSMALSTVGLAIGSNLLKASASLHINNTSSFNSFLVEDDTTPDSSPFIIDNVGRVGIGKLSPSASLDITGRASISSSNGTVSGSTLTVFGSGSALPVFTVQGSQGELFSINDILSGSLFSVNDISGLPILEVFSDSTTLIGNYQDPMLITTAKLVTTASGAFTLYSLPTASYDTAFFEYSIRSGSNARAGTIMAIQSGSAVNFTETTTTDFGSTSGFGLLVQISSGNMILTGSATTTGWTIKTIIRSI